MTTSKAGTLLPFGLAAWCALSCVTRLDGLQGSSGSSSEELDATWSGALSPNETVGSASVSPSSVESEDRTSASASASDSIPTSPSPSGTASSPCINGTLNSAGECVPTVRCAPGTFRVDAEGTIACAACPSGMYSTTFDAEECEPWTVCQPGQYVHYSGTSSSNRVCRVCAEGETSVTENAGECSGSSDCPAGTYKEASDCTPCSPGSHCTGKSDREEICGEGTWDNDGDPSTPCIAVTRCVAGQFVETESTSTTDRVCSFCPSGTFSTESDATGCAEWKTCSAPGQYQSSAPSPSSDRACAACPSGQSAPEDNAVACQEDAPVNLVGNANFESGSTGWFSWNGGVVTATNTKARSGVQSLLVTGPRTGPAVVQLDAAAEAGAAYTASFWVSVGRVSTAQVNITRALTCGGGTTGYLWLANHAAVASAGWTQLVGSFTIPTDCTSPRLLVYAEGGGANVDLYVDDVLITRTR